MTKNIGYLLGGLGGVFLLLGIYFFGGNSHHMTIKNEGDFLLHMIPHHQEAVVSSQAIQERTQNKDILLLTKNIIEAQNKEIGIMKQTLQEKYSGVSEVSYTPMMRNIEKNTPLADHERMYLEDMIHHHEGAIEMAKQMSGVSLTESTQKIVDNIIKTQQDEINLMKRLLTQ